MNAQPQHLGADDLRAAYMLAMGDRPLPTGPDTPVGVRAAVLLAEAVKTLAAEPDHVTRFAALTATSALLRLQVSHSVRMLRAAAATDLAVSLGDNISRTTRELNKAVRISYRSVADLIQLMQDHLNQKTGSAMISNSYVIQRPHSNTNATDNFRVVLYADMCAALSGEGTLPVPAVFESTEYADADAHCKALNLAVVASQDNTDS